MSGIDWKQPYGEVFGADDALPSGARYEQGGRYFDHDGAVLVGAEPAEPDLPATLAEMTRDQLRRYGRENGILFPRGTSTKQAMIEVIEAHEQTGDQE